MWRAAVTCVRSFSSNQRPLRFRIGDVEQISKIPEREELSPGEREVNDPFLSTVELRSHIRWIMQKDTLKQDMLLMGENIGEMRSSVFEWLRLGGREYEFVSLSQDTAHEDLRQRRELVNNSSTFEDQAAVRAAIHGRVLVLEGIEQVERNILPLLNNLLENREITLEDGRILLPPHRADALKQLSTQENIVSVHDDFRVIGLMRMNPRANNSVTTQLDPPLRSRFQARYFPSLSASSLLELSHNISPSLSKASPALLSNYVKVTEAFASFDSDIFQDLLTPPQTIPLRRTISFLKGAEQLFPSFAQSLEKQKEKPFPDMSPFISGLFHRNYPVSLLHPQPGSQAITKLLCRFHFMSKDNNYLKNLSIESIERSGAHSGQAHGKVGDYSLSLPVRTGSHSLTSFHKNDNNKGNYIPTQTSEKMISEMIHDHSLQQDICLVGDKGTGKTIMAQEFAKRLGYDLEGMLLYKDMTSRDLVLRRITKKLSSNTSSSVQDTSWEYSPLIQAAIHGNIAVLDNIDRLPPTTLSTLCGLIQDREMSLFNGERLVHAQRFSELKEILSCSDAELNERGIIRIHPSFRIIATSHNSSPFPAELLELFHFHSVPPMDVDTASTLFSSMVPGSEPEIIQKLVHFGHALMHEESHLNMSFGCREMLRTLQKVSLHTSEADKHAELYRCLANSCLVSFAPKSAQQDFNQLLHSIGLPSKAGAFLQTFELPSLPKRFNIKQANNPVEPETAHLIPEVTFYENTAQTKILEELSAELSLGHHVLLIGNQGVGKNKLCDHLLQTLRLPRQYIQLHRDVTVQSITSQNTLKNGALHMEDSPLIDAVRNGQILVIDEADKAPREVVCILKGLVDGEMILPDGRKIVATDSPAWIHHCMEGKEEEGEGEGEGVNRLIPIHENFRMIVLANRPNWPFQGNDFYAECGELFSCHAVNNPDKKSQVAILSKYAPSVSQSVLRRIVDAFDELRDYAEHGMIAYPYSTRECVSVVKHLENFPNDSISTALSNVLAFDSYDEQAKQYIQDTFSKFHLPLESFVLFSTTRKVINQLSQQHASLDMSIEYKNDREVTSPKHGKEDPDNMPHVGGNTWAGGTGGADTAGLGGKGGPYRLDKGHPVHQISDEEKKNISEEALEAARKMGREELQKRLKEIDMNPRASDEYENYLNSTKTEIDQLRMIMESLKNKGKERVWMRNKTSGDLDDTKLVDALAGDKNVYKLRAESDTAHWKSTRKDKKYLHFLVDVSGSMYRFNSYDQRLERMLEIAVIIMESLAGFDDKLEYAISGHSGDTPNHLLVDYGRPPQNRKERHKVLSKMVTYSQFCVSGDNTVEAARNTTKKMAKQFPEGEKFVFLFSDANFKRYGIRPDSFGKVLAAQQNVQSHAFFIASFWDEAEYIISGLPKGRGHAAMNTTELPLLFKSIFRDHVLSA